MRQSQVRAYESKSVLVTGGAGFIGSHLAESLAKAGANVAVLDNLQAGSWSNLGAVTSSIRCIEGDVRDYETLERVIGELTPEFVFHLAANASVPGSVADPRYDFETNCGGTLALLETLRRLESPARMVLASSAAVYGQPEEFPIVESTPLSPISPYGASKLAAEVESRVWVDVYGTPAVIARLFNTYGPRMPRFVVLDFLRKLDQDPERLEILGSGRQVRDFTYVQDTVEGLMVVGVDGVPGESYNVASGISHTVTELAEMLLRVLGLEGRTRLEYTGESWIGDAQRWEVDVSKLRALGYEPHVPLEDGLRRVLDWHGSPGR